MTLDDVPEELTAVAVEVFNPETPFGGVQIIGVTDTPIQIEFNTGSPVSSVFGRFGDILPLCTDYNQCYAPLDAGVPAGGVPGQILTKVADAPFGSFWADPPTPSSGIPAGGATGQVLTKIDNTDFNADWENIPAGISSVPDAKKIFVTKGGNDSTGARGDLSKPFLTIAAATAAAGITTGDVIVVGPGTFTENAGVELPDNVSLVGMGRNITRIESSLLGTSAPFHGIVAPGNNSVIADIGIVAVSPGGTIDHINPISRRAGATKSWTNVLVRDCYLYGIADVVFAGGASLGNMTFVNCWLEGPNDIVVWQSASYGLFVNCEFKHTTLAGFPALSAIGIYDGGSGGVVRAYGCRFVLGGVNPTGAGVFPLAADSHVEAYDFLIDYAGLTPGSSTRDLNTWTPGALFVSNIRKTGNTALTYDGAPIEIPPASARTVAFLPASPQTGQVATVTDGAASLAFGATVTGGGSTRYGVWFDGTNWKVVAGGTVATGGRGRTSTTLPDSNTLTPDSTFDMNIEINSQASGTMTVNAPTGSPTQGLSLLLRIKVTNAQTFSFNAVFRGSSLLPLPTGLSGGTTNYLGFIWNATDSKWDLTAVLQGY